MLDINLFRTEKGGDPELVRESQRRRFKPVELVDQVVALDEAWRVVRFKADNLRKEFNRLNKEVAKKKIAKEDAADLIADVQRVKAQIEAADAEEAAAEAARDAALSPIGNLVHDSCVVDNNEDNNGLVRTWGVPRQTAAGEKARAMDSIMDSARDCIADSALHNHVDLVNMLGIVNLESGADVAGGRGYYLQGEGTLLNQALIQYALSFLSSRGFVPVHTPFFMKKDIMAECAQLADFDEQLYKVSGEGDDKYLIATSEQTLCALHRGRWFDKAELPIKLAGYSTCFRKEVGSHGRDTLGIFRVHQFEKVEQFTIVHPDGGASWAMMEEMLSNSEAFYQGLGLPYRVVSIVSGALNDAAAKKYDLEAWFPASSTYRELVSCSNCTDYQSRSLESRLRTAKGPADAAKAYVHLLNSTLTATERTLCCLLETWQTAEGVRVPDVLLPFMHGISFVPFRKTLDPKSGKYADLPNAPPFGTAMPTGAGAASAASASAPVGPAGTLYLGSAPAPSSRALRALCALLPPSFSPDVVGTAPPPAAAAAAAVGGSAAAVAGGPVLALGGGGGVAGTQAVLRHLCRTGAPQLLGGSGTLSGTESMISARVDALLEWEASPAGAAALAAGGPSAAAALTQLETWASAAGEGFLAGGVRMSLADLSIACHVAPRAGGAGPATTAWLARVAAATLRL